MKLWLAKNSEIPIKDQLIAQVRVAVAAGDLKPGDRLPSTRELARRFVIHPNTVSAAYRELAKANEVIMRSGSGVFVAESDGSGDPLERLIDSLLSGAEAFGYSRTQIAERIASRLASNADAGFALFEPNSDLAEIVAYEVAESTGVPVSIVEAEDLTAIVGSGLRLIALPDEKSRVADFVPDASHCTFLSVNSVALLDGWSGPADERGYRRCRVRMGRLSDLRTAFSYRRQGRSRFDRGHLYSRESLELEAPFRVDDRLRFAGWLTLARRCSKTSVPADGSRDTRHAVDKYA